MQSRDNVEENNDACCVAGIDGENDVLTRACEINETYTWADESCSLTVDAIHPVAGSSHNLSHADNIQSSECCREADEQSDEVLMGACETSDDVTFSND